MTNRDLKVGDVVSLIDGDDIQMVIEKINSNAAECVWIDNKHKVHRKNHKLIYLIYDGDTLTNTEEINNSSIFKENDEVTLKCCYNVTMVIEEIFLKDGVYKADCRLEVKNKTFKDIFNLNSLVSTHQFPLILITP